MPNLLFELSPIDSTTGSDYRLTDGDLLVAISSIGYVVYDLGAAYVIGQFKVFMENGTGGSALFTGSNSSDMSGAVTLCSVTLSSSENTEWTSVNTPVRYVKCEFIGAESGTVAEIELYNAVTPAPEAPDAPSFTNITPDSVRVVAPSLPEGATSLSLQQLIGEDWVTLYTSLSGGDHRDITGLTIDTEYTFRMLATGEGGETAGTSASITAAAPGAPAPPDEVDEFWLQSQDGSYRYLHALPPQSMDEFTDAYRVRIYDVTGELFWESDDLPQSSTTPPTVPSVNSPNLAPIAHKGYVCVVAVNTSGETEGPKTGFNIDPLKFPLSNTLPMPFSAAPDALLTDAARWLFASWPLPYVALLADMGYDADNAAPWGDFERLHAPLDYFAGETGNLELIAADYDLPTTARLAWLGLNYGGMTWRHAATFTRPAGPDAPPPPMVSIVSGTAADIAGIAFAEEWTSVALEYWRVGDESAKTSLAVTQSAVTHLSGLLSGQPYQARFVATGTTGSTPGPATPFIPGGGSSGSAPSAPGEIELVRLTDTYASLKLPALPANAIELRLYDLSSTFIAGPLVGGAIYIWKNLTPETSYRVRAVAVNAFGQSSGPELDFKTESTASQGSGEEESDDETAPTVTIVAPAANADVAGKVRLRARATDASGITAVRFYVDNVLVDTVTAPNWPEQREEGEAPFEYAALWNARTQLNGPHLLRVEAQDAAGNIGTATRTVHLANTLANQTVQLVFKRFPLLPQHAYWRTFGQALDAVLPEILPLEVAGDDAYNFNWQSFLLREGDLDGQTVPPVVLDEALTLLNRKTTPVLPATDSSADREHYRIVVQGTPRKVWAYYDTDSLRAIRLQPYTENNTPKVAVLAREPNKLFSLGDNVLTLIKDLSPLTTHVPVDALYFKGAFYVAMQPTPEAPASALPYVRWIDPASGREAIGLIFDDRTLNITSLSVQNGQMWIGGSDGAPGGGTGKVWLYDGRPPDPSEATLPGITRLLAGSGGALAGSADGKIFSVTNTGGTLRHSTGEDAIDALLLDGPTAYASTHSTGSNAKIFTGSGSDWTLDQELTIPALPALCLYQTRPHGAGGNLLYRRRAGAWEQFDSLTDVTTIYDLCEYNGALLIATDHAERTLFAREVPAFTPPTAVVARRWVFGALTAYRVGVG